MKYNVRNIAGLSYEWLELEQEYSLSKHCMEIAIEH